MRYPKYQQKTVYNWIFDLAAEISVHTGKTKITETAWRAAAKQRLVKNSLIRIEREGKCYPIFLQFYAIISEVAHHWVVNDILKNLHLCAQQKPQI